MMEENITVLLENARKGDETALAELLPHVYGELRRLAGNFMRRERANHTLQPTALVHEAYLRLIGQKEAAEWRNRTHFFGIAARLMREILIDHARRRKRLKRGGENRTQITFNDDLEYGGRRNFDVIELNDALDKLEQLDKRQANIVELKFFGGLKIEEISEVLEISKATVKREWTTAKMFLNRLLKEEK